MDFPKVHNKFRKVKKSRPLFSKRNIDKKNVGTITPPTTPLLGLKSYLQISCFWSNFTIDWLQFTEWLRECFDQLWWSWNIVKYSTFWKKLATIYDPWYRGTGGRYCGCVRWFLVGHLILDTCPSLWLILIAIFMLMFFARYCIFPFLLNFTSAMFSYCH